MHKTMPTGHFCSSPVMGGHVIMGAHSPIEPAGQEWGGHHILHCCSLTGELLVLNWSWVDLPNKHWLPFCKNEAKLIEDNPSCRTINNPSSYVAMISSVTKTLAAELPLQSDSLSGLEHHCLPVYITPHHLYIFGAVLSTFRHILYWCKFTKKKSC